jgi:hypothetical protein
MSVNLLSESSRSYMLAFRMYAMQYIFGRNRPRTIYTTFKVGLRVSSVLNVDIISIMDKLQVVSFQICYYGFFLQA